ncbi:CHAT domain-containing tetratricopeptide repeat protein [Catenulispora yoronensis]|uniref:CHAT domain-containing protein n=1 Tax=Catenulispora yoronensis TaxID=450799 RepID=UPI0031DAAEDE
MGVFEERLSAACALLDSTNDSDNLELLLTSEVTDLIEALDSAVAALAPGSQKALDALRTLGWLRWRRFIALPRSEGGIELYNTLSYFVQVFSVSEDAVSELPEWLLPQIADLAAPPAVTLLFGAYASREPVRLDAAVNLWQRIVEVTDFAHVGLDGYRSTKYADHQQNLGLALFCRFEHLGAPDDLDAAIRALQAAVQGIPAGHPDGVKRLTLLGEALTKRFESSGAIIDVESAIRAHRAAILTSQPDHPMRARILMNLGDALFSRFKHAGREADLNAAIKTTRAAVKAGATGSTDRPPMLLNLGIALLARYERAGTPVDLDAAIEAFDTALRSQPPSGATREESSWNLVSALLTRFASSGSIADVRRALQELEFQQTDGLPAITAEYIPEADRAAIVSHLGRLLSDRFDLSAAMPDLDRAIDVGRFAIQIESRSDLARATYLWDLASALFTRYSDAGAATDLDESIDAARAAVQTAPQGSTDQAAYTSHLGITLFTRFERTGVTADLDEAIDAMQAAVRATSLDAAGRAMRLSNLGVTLRVRFERSGAIDDLDKAIETGRAAVLASPPDHPQRPGYLSNLGMALRARFERSGTIDDLNEAIETGRAAVLTSPPDHPKRPGYLSNLGNALRVRFERSEAIGDLDEAIEASRSAVAATAPDLISGVRYMTILVGVLMVRSKQPGAAADLDEAIETGRAAVLASPPDHPDRAVCLWMLGTALRGRFELFGRTPDALDAFEQFAAAVDVASASPYIRVRAAHQAVYLGGDLNQSLSTDVLATAVGLLHELTPRYLERSDQQYALDGLAGLASDAAAFALADTRLSEQQRAAQALTLLESGRSVLLSQALETRSDLTDLYDEHPDRAGRYATLCALLNSAPATADDLPDGRPSEVDLRTVAAQFDELLEDIRALPGFSSFGRHLSAEELLAHASEGPIVTFNVSSYRSDALLLTDAGITAIPLPGLDRATVVTQIYAFHDALEQSHDRSASSAHRAKAQGTVRDVLGWLWDVAAEPVLKELGHHQGPTAMQEWPRVWWATGGLLSLLPVHAAGRHDPKNQGNAVIDRVVSSYTPTIRALGYARQKAAACRAGAEAKSLIVAMPTTPDLPEPAPLPGAKRESALLATILPNPILMIEPDSDGPVPPSGSAPATPTLRALLDELPRCAFVHFACHGAHDTADPSRSRLLLHDHATSPLTVNSLSHIRLDEARLAFLSACRTAFHVSELLDEAIHLAGAFQQAGFPHVVAASWEISDLIAVDIAEAFYANLTAPDAAGRRVLDPDRSARALHDTVRTLRERHPNLPSVWASHLHAGA